MSACFSRCSHWASRCVALLILTFANSPGSAGVVEDTSAYLRALNLDFATNDRIYCAPHSRRYSTINPHADYLLNVASAKNIVVFVHGFVSDKIGGEQSLADMVQTWRYHIDLLEELKAPTSYCVVTWDTEYGFDEKAATLARFFAALTLAAADDRIDQQQKNLTLVGHSAGGNYIKYSYLLAGELRRELGKRLGTSISKPYKRHLVTLSTPHLGSEVADTAQMGAFFLQLLGAALGEQAAVGAAIVGGKASSRGAAQLKSIHLNDALYQLNRRFAKVFPKSEIFAIGSRVDSMVSVESATPSFATGYTLNFDHSTFLRPYQNGSFSAALKIIYEGGHP